MGEIMRSGQGIMQIKRIMVVFVMIFLILEVLVIHGAEMEEIKRCEKEHCRKPCNKLCNDSMNKDDKAACLLRCLKKCCKSFTFSNDFDNIGFDSSVEKSTNN